MSADFSLIAGPTDPAWQARLAFLRGADIITDPDDDDMVRREDGYLYYKDTDSDVRALTDTEIEQGRVELGLYDLPTMWVGQYSGMGGMPEDPWDLYIPQPVWRIANIVGEGRILTRGVAGDILAALNLPNRSIYGQRRIHYSPTNADHEAFLDANAGRDRRFIDLGHRQALVAKPPRHWHVGVVRRRDAKRWLTANLGAYVTAARI